MPTTLRNILIALVSSAVLCSLAYVLWLPDVRFYARQNPKETAYTLLRAKQARKAGKKFIKQMYWVGMGGISEHLQHAVVIAEDDTFYRHNGVDWAQFRIAVETNIRERRFAYGGSTITQQLARNLYLSPSKNPLRKIKEMIIARRLEKHLGKRRILELYLNVAEWGKGIFGAEAASRAYFGKPAAGINPEEAVALASIMPSPARWKVNSTSSGLIRRRDNILARMRASGYLPDEVEMRLDETPLDLTISTAPLISAQ
ncbi:MAG: monofunctional biosynthetic peptidoglycan transglycosylase [Elusimicrobia bacterium]|nr:monofunctional biosynthetic peptidoglycan transglycosylase [Elusimicrobiota bacterium]